MNSAKLKLLLAIPPHPPRKNLFEISWLVDLVLVFWVGFCFGVCGLLVLFGVLGF